VLLVAVLGLLVLGGAGPASAHAGLKGTDPDDGAVLKSAPRQVTLTFTESVGLLDDSFRVLDPRNRRVPTGAAQHAPGRSDTARVTFKDRLGEGTYVVAWRVVSADSHPVSGAFTFSVGKPSATFAPVGTGPTENAVTTGLYNIARYLAYLALALLVGAAAFVALCRPADRGPLRTPLVAGWWTLLGTTVVLLVLRAPYETGTSPVTAFDAGAFGRTLTGRPGLALLARLVLLPLAALVAVRLHRRSAPSPPLLAAGAALTVALALTWAAAEHASAGIQVPVAMTSSVLHLLAMTVWLGGLVALLLLLQRTRLPAAAVARFSRLAFASVTVLVVTGVYQSWRGLGSFGALTQTTYGRLLLLKLAAVVLLLAAAGFSRRWTARLVSARARAAALPERVPQPVGGPARADAEESAPAGVEESVQPDAGEAQPYAEESVQPDAGDSAPPGDGPGSRRALRRSVLAEVAVGVVVLVLTTVLTGTLPGRTAAEAAEQPVTAGGLPTASVTYVPFDTGAPNGHGKVQITLDPGRVGDNSVQALVFGPDGGIVAVPEVRLSFSLAAQKLGPLDAELRDLGGYWGTDDLTLPLAGTWTMHVTVRTTDIDQVTVSKAVRIP
jgi:copper transport protein